MNIKSKIYTLRTIHVIGALFLYFSIGVLIYSAVTKIDPKILPYSLTALSLEALLVAINRWDCPLHPLHKKLGDKKAFFGLFMPEKHTRRAMIISIIFGGFSLGLFILVKLIN